jgi:hypothetical protein
MKTGSNVDTAAELQCRCFRAAAWRERLPDISGERRCQSQYRGLRPSETALCYCTYFVSGVQVLETLPVHSPSSPQATTAGEGTLQLLFIKIKYCICQEFENKYFTVSNTFTS